MNQTPLKKDQPAKEFVGRYVFFFTPLLPKEPQFISLVPARVVSLKADRQMYIEPAIAGHTLEKKFTRVGDHIAKVLNSKEDCEQFLTQLNQYHAELSAMNERLMAFTGNPLQQRVRRTQAA